MPLVFMLVFGVLTSIFLTRTVWGYRIYALGGNETATALSGINTDRVKIMVYSLCGFLTAIGGVLMTARPAPQARTVAQRIRRGRGGVISPEQEVLSLLSE